MCLGLLDKAAVIKRVTEGGNSLCYIDGLGGAALFCCFSIPN